VDLKGHDGGRFEWSCSMCEGDRLGGLNARTTAYFAPPNSWHPYTGKLVHDHVGAAQKHVINALLASGRATRGRESPPVRVGGTDQIDRVSIVDLQTAPRNGIHRGVTQNFRGRTKKNGDLLGKASRGDADRMG